jgi:hypothetical protein
MVDTISDENVPPADDRHDIMSDDERGPLVDTDAKQAGMRGNHLAEIALAAARADVLIDGNVLR